MKNHFDKIDAKIKEHKAELKTLMSHVPFCERDNKNRLREIKRVKQLINQLNWVIEILT